MNYLHEFPAENTPSTWAHNDLFLHIIGEQQKRWEKQGFYWKFGLEIDFDLMVGSDGPTLAEDDDPYNKERYTRFAEKYPDYKTFDRPTNFEAQRDRLEGVLARMFEDIRNGLIDLESLSEETNIPEAEMMEELQRYGKELYSDDEETRRYAAKNIFMARIHLYNTDQGGVRDLIEPRFGDAPWGLGWWDKPDDAEIRIPVTTDPLKLISGYHHAIANMKALQDETGVFVHFDSAVHPQLHDSIWRISDNKNMSCADDPESAAFMEQTANGLIRTIQEAPALFQEYNALNNQMIFKGDLGTTRSDQIRQRKTDWEYRVHIWGMTGHLARYIALIMGAKANGVFNQEIYEEWDQKQLTSVRAQDSLILSHKFGKPISALRTTLSHCAIGEDGHLKCPPRETVEYNMSRMLDEIGEDNSNKFKTEPDLFGHTHDLTSPEGWMGLIKSIRITEGNEFDFGDIDPEIAAGIDCLKIEGRRTVFHGQAFVDADNKNRLEKSFPFIEQSPSLRAFIPNDCLPEIADTYRRLYEEAHEERANLFATTLSRHFKRLVLINEDIESKSNDPDSQLEPLDLSDNAIKLIASHYTAATLIEDCIKEEILREVEHMEAYERETTEGQIDRQDEYGYTHLQSLRPYFQAAVANEVERVRRSPQADNWTIHAMQSVSDFLEDGVNDIRSYDVEHFGHALDAWIHVLAEKKIDPMQMELMKFGVGHFVAGFFGMVIRDRDVPLDQIKEMFTESRQRIVDIIDAKRTECADDLLKISEYMNYEEDGMDALKEMGDRIIGSYDHVLETIERIYEGPEREAPTIPAPWQSLSI